MKSLTLGNNEALVIYKGKMYKAIASKIIEGKEMIALFDPSVPTWESVLVPAEEVEVNIKDVFKIGDRVCSVFGQFHGVVTGYEEETNRAICKSDKTSTERCRYAYKAKELRLDTKPVFTHNIRAYLKLVDGSKVYVKPLAHPDREDLLVLYNTNGGNIVTTVPADATRGDLKDLGIDCIIE